MSRLPILVVCALVAIASPAAREIGTAPPQQDSQLTPRYDLDHPFTFTPDFKTREQWLARRDALRKQVLVALGLWPMPARTPLAPVIHGRIDRDGYTVEKVFFASVPGHYVTGNLYRPVGPRREAAGCALAARTLGRRPVPGAPREEHPDADGAGGRAYAGGRPLSVAGEGRQSRAPRLRRLPLRHGRVRRQQAAHPSAGIRGRRRHAAPAVESWGSRPGTACARSTS